MVDYQIWLDLDGVMFNFDKKFVEITSYTPERYNTIKHDKNAVWEKICSTPDFFTDLELMPDAMELFRAVEHLKPWFLTGAKSKSWAIGQKTECCNRYFPDTPIIVTNSEDKFKHMHPGKHNVLIDDWKKYQHLWTNAGGTFILHYTAAETIQELKNLGIL